jgi:hypothetical protein
MLLRRINDLLPHVRFLTIAPASGQPRVDARRSHLTLGAPDAVKTVLAVRGADPGRHERHGNGHRRIGEINTGGDWQTVITTEQNRRLQKMFASWFRPEHADTPKIPALSGLPFNRSPSYR